MGGSETCRLLAEQMLAAAQREPERNKMLLRAAKTWLEFAKILQATEAVNAGHPPVISATKTRRPQPGPVDDEIDGAAFIARWRSDRDQAKRPAE